LKTAKGGAASGVAIQKGGHVAIDPGPMSRSREIEKSMGIPLSEEDYTLFNKRTGGKAISRKNDWEIK